MDESGKLEAVTPSQRQGPRGAEVGKGASRMAVLDDDVVLFVKAVRMGRVDPRRRPESLF